MTLPLHLFNAFSPSLPLFLLISSVPTEFPAASFEQLNVCNHSRGGEQRRSSFCLEVLLSRPSSFLGRAQYHIQCGEPRGGLTPSLPLLFSRRGRSLARMAGYLGSFDGRGDRDGIRRQTETGKYLALCIRLPRSWTCNFLRFLLAHLTVLW